jgi:uncharacterized membrane protein YesL
MKIFKIMWRSLIIGYETLFSLLLMGATTLLATVPIITAPFAWAGMRYIAQRAVEGRSTTWADYWQGIKQYGPRNVANQLLLILFFGSALGNLWFYNNPAVSPLPPEIVPWLSGVWIVGMVIGSGVAFYLLAFQMEMAEPRFWSSLRNSLFLTLLRPIQTLIAVLFLLIVAVGIRFVPPIILLYPGLLAVLSANTVKTFLKAITASQETQERPEKSGETL